MSWAYDLGIMDLVLGIGALLVLAAPVGLVAAFAVARGPAVMSEAFMPRRPEGWPRGVQEEDPSFQTIWRLGPSPALVIVPDRNDAEDAEAGPAPIVLPVGRSRLRRRQDPA